MRRVEVAFALIGGLLMVWGGEAAAHAQPRDAVLNGTVVDGDGAPLPAVNVWVSGTTIGAVTDSTGQFQLQLTSRSAPYVLVATRVGFDSTRTAVTVEDADPEPVRLVLERSAVEMDKVVVSTSTFTTGIEEGVTISPLDVVTTPGSSADVYRTIQTYPGVSAVDKGSGLFVRGGDRSETVTLIDNATVTHPYKFESPTTSTFGTLPPFLVQGTSFSAGGFSARYGNALSAVLDMDSQGYPDQRSVYANVSLAATSVGVDVPVTDEVGIRFSGNRSFTDLLFRVNQHNDEFNQTPQSTEANLNLVYNYSETGTVKFFNFHSRSTLGVRVEEASFSGVFANNETNWLHSVYWTDQVGDWTLEANASTNQFESEKQFGALDTTPTDQQYKGRVDATRPLFDNVELHMGGEVLQTENRTSGTVPSRPSNSGSDPVEIDYANTATRAGGYVEAKTQLTQHLAGRLGLRSDFHSLTETAVFDPRASVRYQFLESTDLRVAWGIYHQFPEPKTFGMTRTPDRLGAQQAQHFIVGAEHESKQLNVRVEGYYKPYDDLVLERSQTRFTNEGEGTAFGGDFFLQYGGFLETPIYGHLSYSYLQSERVQPRQRRRDVVLEKGPSPFEITHNLKAVIKGTVPSKIAGGFLSGGITIRHATGKPITPVTDAISSSNGNYFLPIEGSVGSDRLPAYRRIDAQVNFYLPLRGNENNVVFYASANNILGRTNALDYTYSSDYSERKLQKTNLERSFYFGAKLNWSF